MSTDISLVRRSHEESWLPILELAVEEVFEIMLGCRVKPIHNAEQHGTEGCTAVVGLAGALCGMLTFSCSPKTARAVAQEMLGVEIAASEEQVSDALGEICNMIAGNFESGSAEMKAASQPAFDRIAGMLLKRDCRVRIEGHTDNIPIHNARFSSNWELATARATEIVRLLIVRNGFSPSRLSAAGYAEYHAIASNATAEGRGTNRRVDIVILGRDIDAAPPTRAVDPSQSPAATAPPVEPKMEKPSPAVGKVRASPPARHDAPK